MEHVLCFAIILAIATTLVANIIYFKKALDCVRQKRAVSDICKRLRVLFGVFPALWLAGGVLDPPPSGGTLWLHPAHTANHFQRDSWVLGYQPISETR